jgi:23S rRNA (cytidine1920-2'-O)/16S rRNA (cytidine1409-2'-O)-methyltransferase
LKKERLDKFLVDLGYFENKSKASASILAGNVMIGTEVISKAGLQIDTSKEYEFKIKSMPYVSRGGFKLKKALDAFNFSPKDRICLDAGASTGGFTDCSLKHGAKKVIGIDVGTDLMVQELRNDSRVELYEQLNIKDANNVLFNYVDIIVSDVSFISLRHIIDKISSVNKDFELVFLIKPQFECGKEIATKYKGIIKDKDIHYNILKELIPILPIFGAAGFLAIYLSLKYSLV